MFGNLRLSFTPDANDIGGFYEFVSTYTPGLSGYKILSFDASNPLGSGSLSMMKIDWNRKTVSIGPNTNAADSISANLYVRGSRDMIKAVFDGRSTLPSTNMVVLGEYTPTVTVLANPADTSATKKNPIALQTELGGINIT